MFPSTNGDLNCVFVTLHYGLSQKSVWQETCQTEQKRRDITWNRYNSEEGLNVEVIPSVETCLLHALSWCQNTLQILVYRRSAFGTPPEIFWHKQKQRICFNTVVVSYWNSMYQLGFYDGEVRSNLPFLKSAETVFLLAAGTVTFKWFI